MSKRKPSLPSAKQKQRRAAQRREKVTKTRVKGLYYPTGVAPDEFYRELGRLRKAAEAEIERLLVFIDALDDPDLEPDADFEPTLGFVGTFDQEDCAMGDRTDLEEAHGDDEPSLGTGPNGEPGYHGDLEDEHDGAEPDFDNEPSLGASEVVNHGAAWAPQAAMTYDPEGDEIDIAGEIDGVEHDSNAVIIREDGGPCAHATAEAMAAQLLVAKRREVKARTKGLTAPPPPPPRATDAPGDRMLVVGPEFFR